jgi:hypothetical protein
MEDALPFFKAFEVWIYLVLGLAAGYFIYRFILAWQDLRDAAFGLERESAQAKVNQAASLLVLLLSMAVAEFVLVTFIAPAMPGAAPLPTPTVDLLATPTTTLVATTLVGATLETPQASTPAAVTPTPVVQGSGCAPDQIVLASPQDGAEISGVVEIRGTANIPNFGFYKLEMKTVEATDWLTILAGNEVRIDSTLGFWNTSLLVPGVHQLSLVVTDNQGQTQPPCVIQVRVSSPAATNQP